MKELEKFQHKFLNGSAKRVLVVESSAVDCMPRALMKRWAKRSVISAAFERVARSGRVVVVLSSLCRKTVTGLVPVDTGVHICIL